MDAPALIKVTAFVTRPNRNTPDLMLIQHPHAGYQLPAGTVEPGEALETAIQREVREETGLTNAQLVAYIGVMDETIPPDMAAVVQSTKVYARPDRSSFDWIHIPRGFWVHVLRRENDFLQITYEEANQLPRKQYTTYQLTGWVPAETLAFKQLRHFYHLSVGKNTRPPAQTMTDHHTYRPLWAPLDDLPEIMYPQKNWLHFVLQEKKYEF